MILGTSEGVVRFIDVGDRKNVKTIKVLNIYDKAIKELKVSHDHHQIALLAEDDDRIFFIALNNKEKMNPIKLLGFVAIPTKLESISWVPEFKPPLRR